MKARLAAACAALVLVLVGTACGSRVENWPEGALEPTDYYAERTATTRALGKDAEAGDTTTATSAAAKKQQSAKRGSSTATATTVTGALPAPAPGTYTYDQTTSVPGSPAERETSTEKWAVSRGASEVTLTQTAEEGDDDFAQTTTSTYRVRTSVLELVSQKIEFTDEEPETCTYKPPFLVLRLPLSVGQKWKANTACEDDDPDDAEELEFEVTGTADDVIGGEKVRTFLVRTEQSLDTTDDTTGESMNITYVATRHIDPATLLAVIEELKVTFGDDTTTTRRVLRKLKPS